MRRSSQRDNLAKEYHNIPKVDKSIPLVKVQNTLSQNRYENIRPYQWNKVTAGGKYINASWLSSSLHKNKYIATQAPLPNTCHLFWQMIYEYKIPAIYMLTSFCEKGQVKANCYWPTMGTSLKIGSIIITLTDYRRYSHCQLEKRTFSIYSRPDNISHLVQHYHYTGWPDFAAPKNQAILNKVLDLMDRHYNNGPQVIHCSAGVGRTGTLIALHSYLLARGAGIVVKMYDIVKSLRKERSYMVNDLKQYIFLHDYIKCL